LWAEAPVKSRLIASCHSDSLLFLAISRCRLGFLPIGMLIITSFAFGLGVLLGIFNVFVRDVGQVFSVVVQIWFWLTPVVYTSGALPKRLSWIAEFNPMAPLVKLYQDAMLYDTFPQWRTLLIPTLISASLFILSFMVFRRASADLVDEL
jgi:lipopolysaccharide transport system permease protein